MQEERVDGRRCLLDAAVVEADEETAWWKTRWEQATVLYPLEKLRIKGVH